MTCFMEKAPGENKKEADNKTSGLTISQVVSVVTAWIHGDLEHE